MKKTVVKRRKRHARISVRVRRRKPRNAVRFTRKANTPKRRRQWKHVYRSARTRGYTKGRAIAQASGVIRKETLKHNPVKKYLIEAMTLQGTRPKYFYWNDPEQKFTSKREQAAPYSSERAARIEAKKLLPKLPSIIRTLRTVPA